MTVDYVRERIEKIRQVLNEADSPDRRQRAFDMENTLRLHVVYAIAEGKCGADSPQAVCAEVVRGLEEFDSYFQ
jgi:hypothetical protein